MKSRKNYWRNIWRDPVGLVLINASSCRSTFESCYSVRATTSHSHGPQLHRLVQSRGQRWAVEPFRGAEEEELQEKEPQV